MSVELVVLGVSTAVARTREVPRIERHLFCAVNELPDALHRPVHVVMQSGSLAAVFVAAGAARSLGQRRLAWTVAVSGVTVWGGAKVMKRWVGRGRPTGHLAHVELRGDEQGGLGFPSGHAAVAFCLASLGGPELPPAARPLVWAVAGGVAFARVNVGAHLPLDVIGGAALGVLGGYRAGVVLAATRP